MTHYHDPDPTPAHGTPRPMTEETVFVSPCDTYRVTVRNNPARGGWEVITYNKTTGEMADLPNVRPLSGVLPVPFHCYEVALSVALGIEDAWLASYHAYCAAPVPAVVSRGVWRGHSEAPNAFGNALER